MDFRIHSDVREPNGAKLGELRHVVLDTDARAVVSLVVQQTGLDGHAVIVPIASVVQSDEDAVYLSLMRDEFDTLQTYAYGRNIAPPPADMDSDTVSSDQVQEPIDVPDVPPVGAATGITSIAFTPILEVWRNLPPDSIVIDDGTDVAATDGTIGPVKQITVDDQSRAVTEFVVREGVIFTHDVPVPVNWLAAVRSDRIMLRVDKRTVEARVLKEL